MTDYNPNGKLFAAMLAAVDSYSGSTYDTNFDKLSEQDTIARLAQQQAQECRSF